MTWVKKSILPAAKPSFKNGKMGFEEILIIILSLVGGFMIFLLLTRVLHVPSPK